MLQNLTSITGVGLFSNSTAGASLPLKNLTLIYAENGRGKSTLASVLAAASSGDATRVKERATIDQDVVPKVSLRLADGRDVSFDGVRWSEPVKTISVFDSQFIAENIHSGHEVTTDQRKNLLSFALGSHAVAAQETERAATQAKKDAGDSLRLQQTDVRTHSNGMDLQEFEALPEVADVDSEISSKQGEIDAARAQQLILNQPMPVEHDLPDLDLNSIFTTLAKTLGDVHSEAEAEVSKHINDVNKPGALEWISQGQIFDDSTTCPYCGQDTSSVDLVKSYRTHFDAAYLAFQKSIKAAIEEVNVATRVEIVTEIQRHRIAVTRAMEAWKKSGVTLNTLSGASDMLASADLAACRQQLTELLNAKLQDLASVPHTPEAEEEARGYWEKFSATYISENGIISKQCEAITQFKASLANKNVPEIESQLRALGLSKVRYSRTVIAKVEKLKTCRIKLAEAEGELTQARSSLKELMDSTLDIYATQINAHLRKQSAAFEIDQLSTNFMGSAPRTKYGIKLRGVPVNLTGATASFRTALSEGDKRTMAFAFFVASTLADRNLSEKIVVLDDPMSSLDRNRRSHTIGVLKKIAQRCAQLIVLAHDPKFLLDTLDEVGKIKIENAAAQRVNIQTVCLQISPQADLYSDISVCDLERECESQYVKHYRCISDFVANPSGDAAKAAGAIRPLLEGYLHRRYPGEIPRKKMFGTAVTKIEGAPSDSPLCSAKDMVEELRDIAYFGGGPHHDTEPDMPWAGLNATEIHGYARRAIDLVHGV